MPSKSRKACRRPTDIDGLRLQLHSADERVRLRALHSVCPCGAGFSLYERLLVEVRRLRKDPSPEVRRMALHVEQDAVEIELIESNLARAAEAGHRAGDADWTRRKLGRQSRRWEPLAP